MNRIILLFILATFITSSCKKNTEQKLPNIIVILSDDQGWGDLSYTGNTNISTPNIDKIAETGVFFDRFYVCPVCSPTRAEFLTGRYHVRGGVYSTSAGGERLDLDETTIADVFRNAGYKTAAYGKWHNGMQAPYHPNARGFEDFYGFCSGHWGNYYSPMLEHNGEIVKGDGFIIDDLTNHGLQFIEQNKNTPFFLYLPFNTPHAPMQVPDRWWQKFKNKEPGMKHHDPDKEEIMFTNSALAMCENIDWNVGRITQKLDELDLSENTIVIYFSDNGPNSWRWNNGMKGRKGSTDEGGVRSPFFIKWPGKIQGGKKITTIASAVDLLPTLTDLAGIKYQTKKPLDGLSLKRLLTEENPEWNDRFIFNHWGKRTSVRNQKYRLDNDGKLFDMENDSGQETDISDNQLKITQQMISAKEKWENEVLTELPEKDYRAFTIAHPDFIWTQIPARDGTAHGNIQRSNRYPNCTFFTNWMSTTDSITWDAEVLADGKFDVTIYYTCPASDVGSTFQLNFGNEKLISKIEEAHDPPLTGMEHDLIPRWESYVKEFKPLNIGTIELKKGKGTLTLKALEMPGSQVMDFRLLMLRKI
ncbi:sulfatase-like hydrolase/transferase [Maribellus comscasis]|uniref:Sulfatase-like hydrolase/transferase n=1 Tax=Maribellus comscasis TaxID=2681766 RepID=A0A6I6JMN6_9BACT|nr:arylsulfatase [Maribellus comscasis]QGY42328.1 sulfatase-like hydrolase/transferase [Maribellus comscasis]